MSTMREKIEERVERLENFHRSLKQRRHGWLVRPGVLTVGTLVMLAGVAMIPLPGQGWLTVFLGIAILSLEAQWAKSVLSWSVGAYDWFGDWYRLQPLPVRIILLVSVFAVILGTFAGITWVVWFR